MTPDGTFGTVIETPEGTWLLGPNGETARANHMNGGIGSLYCWSANVLYVQGSDARWYVWRTGNHWELFGPNPPIPLPAPPPVVSLPRVVVRGDRFALATGQRVTVIQCSDFQLYQRFLAGEDLAPVLTERRELGFNTLRVLGMCSGMFRLFPNEHPTYYDSLKPFADLCASHGLYVEFTVFADATVAMPSGVHQVAHWQAVGAAVQPLTNVSLEACNEADQTINRLTSIQQLRPIPGVLCSHGSNGSQAVPVRPAWDYETFHTNDAPEFQRKVGHNAMELSHGAENLPASHVPILSNENTRPDRDGNWYHFYDAAAGAALLCAGSCFHSQSGKASVLFSGQDREFAAQWVAGARSVDLACQDGSYVRRDDLLTPALLRVYEQRLPNGGVIVRIRK